MAEFMNWRVFKPADFLYNKIYIFCNKTDDLRL